MKKEEPDTFSKEDEEPVVFLSQDKDSKTFWKEENGGPEIFLSKDLEVDNRHEEKSSTRSSSIGRIRSKLEKKMGKVYGLEDIYQDNSWDGLVKKLMKIGMFFEAGELNLAYVDKGETTDFILVPGHETTVISISPKCPKERIMQILCD